MKIGILLSNTKFVRGERDRPIAAELSVHEAIYRDCVGEMALWFNVIHIPIGCFALYALFDVLERHMLNGERGRAAIGRSERAATTTPHTKNRLSNMFICSAKLWFWVSAFVFVYYITYYDSMNFARFKPHRVQRTTYVSHFTHSLSQSAASVYLHKDIYLFCTKQYFIFLGLVWFTGWSVGRHAYDCDDCDNDDSTQLILIDTICDRSLLHARTQAHTHLKSTRNTETETKKKSIDNFIYYIYVRCMVSSARVNLRHIHDDLLDQSRRKWCNNLRHRIYPEWIPSNFRISAIVLVWFPSQAFCCFDLRVYGICCLGMTVRAWIFLQSRWARRGHKLCCCVDKQIHCFHFAEKKTNSIFFFVFLAAHKTKHATHEIHCLTHVHTDKYIFVFRGYFTRPPYTVACTHSHNWHSLGHNGITKKNKNIQTKQQRKSNL